MTESRRAIVLPGEVSVVNLGLSLFADAVRDQAAPVEEVDWRIPAGGQMDLVDALEQLEGPRAAGIDRANAEAVRRLDRSVPLLVDVAPAGTLIPDLSGRMLLHCGPAIEWAAVCDPLRRSMRAAAVAEGWAGTVEQADRILADGSVRLQPAYRYDTVMPMASAIGPSAPVFAVDNRDGGTRAFAPVNQGPGETAWFGRETPAAIARLEFLRDVGGPMLRDILDSSGPIDIFALAAQGVQIGDDVHMRTQGTTNLLIRNLLPQIAALPDAGTSRAGAVPVRQPPVLPQPRHGSRQVGRDVGRAGRGIEHRHDDVPQRNVIRQSSWPARARCSPPQHRPSKRRCTTPTTAPRRARPTSGTARSSSWWDSAARPLPAHRRSPGSCRAGWPTRSA